MCQVFSTDFYGGAWSDAVNATRGMVLVNSSGYVFSSEYAAVHGGYINNVGYDVKEGEGSWIGRAWENLSGVSWFYKNWFLYNGNSCSAHPNPWLTSSEMADLLNAYQYLKNGGSKEDPRFTSVDVSTCWGKSDNPYSHTELRSLVSNPITSVSSVSTTNSDGWTTALRFYTDRGEFLISGTDNTKIFRDAYNLRAPGFLSIPQSDPYPGFIHINIEKK